MTTTHSSEARAEASRAPSGLRFTEKMTGYVALGETDALRGYRQGLRENTPLTFRLTISTDDVRRMVDDREHSAVAQGWIDCDALGGRLPVERGEFNLFVADAPRRRQMLYRLWFADGAGHRLTLRAHKVVDDDAGLDAWADTTTLFTQVLIGHVDVDDDADAVVTAAGVLRIRPLDFAHQLTTFRASGPSVRDRASAMALFGGFFLGQLWRVYRPIVRGRTKSGRDLHGTS